MIIIYPMSCCVCVCVYETSTRASKIIILSIKFLYICISYNQLYTYQQIIENQKQFEILYLIKEKENSNFKLTF
jgi:hypothetical protein